MVKASLQTIFYQLTRPDVWLPLSILYLLLGCTVMVNAQSQPIVEEKNKSAEEMEADKLNGDVVRLFREQKYQEALPLAKRALELREQKLGAEHQMTMVSMKNLASVYAYLDKHKEAIELYQRLLKIQEKVFGPNDPKLDDTISKLGWERMTAGSNGAAESLFKRHLQIWEKAFGPDHPNTVPGLNDLALYYQRTGSIDQALSFYRRMIAIDATRPDQEGAVQAERLVKSATLLRMTNKKAEADEYEQQAQKIYAARTTPSKTIHASDDVLQGAAILRVLPEYPSTAKQARVRGTVRVSVEIDKTGIPVKATAIDGPAELKKAAEEAARKWRFKLTELAGSPVKVIGVLTFNFTLE